MTISLIRCFKNGFGNNAIALRIKIGKYNRLKKIYTKSGNNITLLGGGHWTVPELLFGSKKLIPALHQLLTGG
jgi:hypothetical protein